MREISRVARKYIVHVERTHLAPTKTIAEGPPLRRVFNPQDILDVYKAWGYGYWQWAGKATGGQEHVLGLYVIGRY